MPHGTLDAGGPGRNDAFDEAFMTAEDRTSRNEETGMKDAPGSVAPITREEHLEARYDTKRAVWISQIVLLLVGAQIALTIAATVALYDRIADLSETVGGLSATVSNLSGAVERIEAGQREIVTRLAAAEGRLEAVDTRLGALEDGVAGISGVLAEMQDDILRGSLLMPGTHRTVAPSWTPEILENYLVARVDADDMRGVILYETAERRWYLATAPTELFALPTGPPSVLTAVAFASAPTELRSYVEGVLGLPAR